MKRRHVSLVLGLTLSLLLVPQLLPAQVRRPPGRARPQERLELERRIRARFGQMVRKELGLGQEQLRKLQEVMGSFRDDRMQLQRRRAELQRILRREGTLALDEERARELLRSMVEIQEAEVELYRKEQARLLEVLTPQQLLRFYQLREELGRRIQRLRAGAGPGRGRGGGGGALTPGVPPGPPRPP